MADPMKIRAQMAGDKVEVRVLMAHEMETGQRKDASGKVVPAWFIQNVTATHNGRTVLSAEWARRSRRTASCRFASRAASPATRCRSPGPTTTATSARTKRRLRRRETRDARGKRWEKSR